MPTIAEVLQIAQQHLQSNRLPQAEQAYRQILQVQPNQPHALYGLARIALQVNKLAEGEQFLQTIIQTSPNFADAWFSLGNLRTSQSRWAEAINCYEEVITLQPQESIAHNHYAYVLERQEQFEAASARYHTGMQVQHTGIEVVQRSALDTIYHCCTQKTASQWFRAVFNDAAFYRYTGLVTYPFVQLGLRSAFIPKAFPSGTVATHLYIDHPTYENIPKPDRFKTFFILRDPRDSVVSWYFSAKHSHTPVNPMPQLRQDLEKLDLVQGLQYIIDKLVEFGSFDAQRSWQVVAGHESVALFRYEDLVSDSRTFLTSLFAYLDITMPQHEIDSLSERFSFEKFSGGRKQGQEDVHNHYRKGIAGDWKNYFDESVLRYFNDKTDDLVKVLGYES